MSTTPAELILLRGPASYVTVGNTKLLWVNNTGKRRLPAGQDRPGLLPDLRPLVQRAGLHRPVDVRDADAAARVQADPALARPLARARVGAGHRPGRRGRAARAESRTPRRINKKEIKAPEVAYQGDAAVRSDPEDDRRSARPTPTRTSSRSATCITCASRASGSCRAPRAVRGQRPDPCPSEIYEIPVSSPSHNVTYVTVEDDDDDDWAVYATAAAYTGMMIGWGCAVWGSGYYYPPYVGYGGFYPAYYPHYPTYGYGASYNPWTGAYSRGMVVYGPYGGAGVGARYNPRTGTYSRGAAAYGPYGSRGAASAYNPRTGAVGDNATRFERLRQLGIDGGSARRQLGDDVARNQQHHRQHHARDAGQRRRRRGHAQYPGTGRRRHSRRPATATFTPAATATSTEKDSGGGWSEANGNNARPDTTTAGQLNRDSAARAEGAQRTKRLQQFQRRTDGRIELPPERRGAATRRRRRTTTIANKRRD